MTRPLPRPRPSRPLDVSLAIVNIVLLLIFFFLVTGRLLNPVSADLDLSETSELPLDLLPSPILVVAENGDWFLDGAPVVPDLLPLALEDLPQPVVLHLMINRAAPSTVLIGLLNRAELRETEIRLVTLHRRGGL